MTTSSPGMKLSVRTSLITIAALGAVLSFVSLFALSRLMASTNAQRLERARDAVAQQLVYQQAVALASPQARGAAGAVSPRIGMRSGYLNAHASIDSIGPEFRPALRAVLQKILAGSDASADMPTVQTIESSEGTIVFGAVRISQDESAWAAYAVQPPPWLRNWRIASITLGLGGLALVLVSLQLAASMHRGANLLRASLRSLARNLDAPVQRPAVRELGEVADGIRALAAQLRTAEQEHSRLNRALADRERLASLGRVVAGVAHEVRNPLAAIKLRVDLARMDPHVPATVASELGEASDEIARLDRLVSELLVAAGKRVGPRSNADLRGLCEQRVALLEPWAKEHRVRISVDGTGGAEVDADAIGQALDNLLRNAIEASPAQGSVSIDVQDGGTAARILVTDQGPGVASGRVDELFEPFFTTKPGGTGLGLALSRAIASAHGGSLRYERRGDRTVFELELPAGVASGRQETPG